MRLRPYIGITDFTDFEQVKAMQEVFLKHRKRDEPHMLHVGVMTSFKTFHFLQSKWTNAFPPKEKFAEIFSSDQVYNCLHYADYAEVPMDLAFTLERALKLCGDNLHALQLDMPWPDPLQVQEGIRDSGKKIEVILQLSSKAMEMAGTRSVDVVKKLVMYDGVIDRVLLDMSGGRGIPMDADRLILLARVIRAVFPDMGLVIAGGFGPGTVARLAWKFLSEFPDASLDAQGKLRPSGNALDPIDWNMAAQYLVEALDVTASDRAK